MQTFLPYPDFYDSARTLDQKRLGKQRVETYQLMNAIVTGLTADGRERRGYINHPAARMWRGYERAFLDYQEAVVAEWVNRGYEDTCWPKTLAVFTQAFGRPRRRFEYPFWFGDPAFHISHQSNLIAKFPEWYGPQFPFTPDNLEYVWPV